MNPIELKIARIRRKISGKEAADALHLTIDGYLKKEHGNAGITLADALALAKAFDLTLDEFVSIFFDGKLPFLQDGAFPYENIEKAYYPLKEAREQAGLSVEDCASKLGISVSAYKQREKGKVQVTLQQCATLSVLLWMSFDTFNAVFFRSALPFRKVSFASDNAIIHQRAGEINAASSYSSGV